MDSKTLLQLDEDEVITPKPNEVEEEDNPIPKRLTRTKCKVEGCGEKPSVACDGFCGPHHLAYVTVERAKSQKEAKEFLARKKQEVIARVDAKVKAIAEDLEHDAPAAGSGAAAATSEASGGLEMPEECMYGEAKVLAAQMKISPGLAYPALIGCYSIKPEANVMCGDTLLTTYVALCATVGGGKNVAMDRAQRLLELVKEQEYQKAAPAGVRGLFTLIGDKPSGKRNDKSRIAGPKKLLLLTHEMTDVLKMTGIENSTLASRLCDIWDDPEFTYPVKEAVIGVNCRLSWIGGVPCSAENPTRFTELFDSETSHGLFDRMILGYTDAKFNYKPWSPPASKSLDYSDYTALTPPFVEGLEPEAQTLLDNWDPKAAAGNRAKQNCLKVAIITTMMNHERKITAECMRCAIQFMEWQTELRAVFQPGEAINDAARCRELILQALRQKGAAETFINIKRLAHDRKWGAKFGDWMVKSVITSLVEMGELVPKVVEGEPSKSMFKLRDFSKT